MCFCARLETYLSADKVKSFPRKADRLMDSLKTIYVGDLGFVIEVVAKKILKLQKQYNINISTPTINHSSECLLELAPELCIS